MMHKRAALLGGGLGTLPGLSAMLAASVNSPASGRGLWYRPANVAADNVTTWPTRRYLALLRHNAQNPGRRAKHRGRPTIKYRRKANRR